MYKRNWYKSLGLSTSNAVVLRNRLLAGRMRYSTVERYLERLGCSLVSPGYFVLGVYLYRGVYYRSDDFIVRVFNLYKNEPYKISKALSIPRATVKKYLTLGVDAISKSEVIVRRIAQGSGAKEIAPLHYYKSVWCYRSYCSKIFSPKHIELTKIYDSLIQTDYDD